MTMPFYAKPGLLLSRPRKYQFCLIFPASGRWQYPHIWKKAAESFGFPYKSGGRRPTVARESGNEFKERGGNASMA